MGLFSSKKDKDGPSVFDQLPQETQDKILRDILTIVETLKTWTTLGVTKEQLTAMFDELKKLLSSGVTSVLWKSRGDIDNVTDTMLTEAFKDVKLPGFLLTLKTEVMKAVNTKEGTE